jgi:peptidyl-prolyl cis-trans isomerase A (cyclophilin A)
VEVDLLQQAPRTVEHVLELVRADAFDGSTFYRAQRREHWVPGREFTGLQGGPQRSDLPTVEHEAGAAPHGLGTVSLARLTPGTASAELFICLDAAAPMLDPGAGPPMDGLGYAVFGRVASGLSVLQRIHMQPTLADAPHPLVRGQLLAKPIAFSVRS